MGDYPELMFQDWENIPAFLISESSLHQDTFRYFEVISEMNDDRAKAFELYCCNIISWPANGNDLDEKHWKILMTPIRDIMVES